jgi:hypothetical protein
LNGIAISTAAALVGMTVPALADSACMANAEQFERGQYACLTASGTSQLARCEMNLNILSWNKVLDHCPGGSPPKPTFATPFVCRANDQLFPVGGFACLTLDGRKQLSRCDAVLNNSSWTKVQDGCPGPELPVVAPDTKSRPWFGHPFLGPRGFIQRLRDAL